MQIQESEPQQPQQEPAADAPLMPQGGYAPHLQPIPQAQQQPQPQVVLQPGTSGSHSSRSDEQANKAQPAGPPIKLRKGEQWALLPAVPADITVPPGLEYLLPCKRAHVRQKTDLVEVFTSFDTPNKYAIYNDRGQFMYYAREQQRGSDFFAAQFMRECRGFYFTVTDGLGRPAFSIARSSKMWTDCEMRVDAPPGVPAGYATYNSSMCSRGVLTIFDRRKRPVLSIPFPDACDCGGERGYPVVSGAERVGAIVRQYPGFMEQVFTTCDNFALKFPLDLDVRIKCTLLACAIMIDFIDFEDKRGGNRRNKLF